MSAPAADGAAIDVNHFDLTSDSGLITDDMYVPCLRHFGDFKTSAVLAAPNPISFFNSDDNFTAAAWTADVYRSLGASDAYSVSTGPMSAADVAAIAREARKRGTH